jgi:hypothetical protein
MGAILNIQISSLKIPADISAPADGSSQYFRHDLLPHKTLAPKFLNALVFNRSVLFVPWHNACRAVLMGDMNDEEDFSDSDVCMSGCFRRP